MGQGVIVTAARCECGEIFMALFTLHFCPQEIEYRFIDRGIERHLAAGHEVEFTKTGRFTFKDD